MLFVVCDGPMSDREKILVEQSIEVVRNEVDWDCDVHWNIADSNLGLARRVSSGLTWAFESCDRAIILEDDCVADPSFFRFCDEMLKRHDQDRNVMAVTGNNFQNGIKRGSSSYYYSMFPHCWGWATWKRAWDLYDGELLCWSETEKFLASLNDREALKYWRKIKERVVSREVDSWAYRWTFSVWAHHGLVVTPCVNLVENIGSGEEATHTKNLRRSVPEAAELSFPLVHPEAVTRDVEADWFASRNWFRIPVSRSKLEVLPHRECNRLKRLKRFVPGQLELHSGRSISYIDAASFLSTWQEIMEKEIYLFASETESPKILDGGANIGLASIYFKNIYPKAGITAFEPDPDAASAFERNMLEFGIKDVVLVKAGLAAEAGSAKFHREGADGGSFKHQVSGDRCDSISVEITTLSGYLNGRVDLLKLDIEGSEVEVLQAIQNDLTHVQRIFVEYHRPTGEESRLSVILEILEKAGFSYQIQPGMKCEHPFIVKRRQGQNFDMLLNIFAFRPNDSRIVAIPQRATAPRVDSSAGKSFSKWVGKVRRLVFYLAHPSELKARMLASASD